MDAGISGAKGRDGRPGLDTMLNDASRRKFDVVMAWAIDRLGRSLVDLLGTIQGLEACGVDLYLDQQNIDTTTPVGKLLFQITGAFAEFERSMIRTRVNAGLKRAKGEIKRKGHSRARSKSAIAGRAPIQRSCARHKPSLPRESASTESPRWLVSASARFKSSRMKW
jgi:DNA invertase Pin-like site-specific DNA recombinase